MNQVATTLRRRSVTRAPGALRALVLLVLAGPTALLVANVLPYFGRDGATMPFLLEKGAQVHTAPWRAAFLAHVVGGTLCLLVALPLFSRTLLRRRPRWHRVLGWTYVVTTLGVVAPTGLWLAPGAKGGLAGQAGFTVIGLSLLLTTALGLREVLRRDVVAHRAWMVRSYALAASALSFRVLYVALEAAQVPRAYVIGVWLSWGLDLVLAEAVLARGRTPHPPRTLSPRRTA